MKRFHAIMAAFVMAVSIMACGQEAEQSDWSEAEAIGIVETAVNTEPDDNTDTEKLEVSTKDEAKDSALAASTVKDGVE